MAFGIDDILIVTAETKDQLKTIFDKYYELEYSLQKSRKDCVLKQVRKITDLSDACYIRQRDIKGLGDAIAYTEKYIQDEHFAVLLGDSITRLKTPITKQLIDVFFPI